MKLMLVVSSMFRIVKFVEVISMKKFRRRKSAFALACASISGGKTQAMNKNKPQNPQSLVAVGGSKIFMQLHLLKTRF